MPEDMVSEEQPEVEELDEILVPEQILAHTDRKVRGKVARRYLVKFKNYSPMDAKWMEEAELLYSFETELAVPALASAEGGPSSFRAVFIRAPAILETGPAVEVLADYTVTDGVNYEDTKGITQKVAVAVKQGNLLATAFHPELTSDTRW
ncbi:hypothetical protein L7F22_029511 [Adiantum nelumboides]|nr:hypothetical protein [Adiantum nelumboides]